MNRPGDSNVPDTAIAHTVHTLGGILPVALTCMGASATVLILAIAFAAEGTAIHALAEAIIMTFVSYAVMRHFLSNGEAPVLAPPAMVRAPGFVAFLQLELLATIVLQLATRLSDVIGMGVVESAGYVLVLFAYARYGTILPALVTGGDASLAAAEARDTTRALVWRLFAAVALGFTMMASLILLPSVAVQQGMGADSPSGLFVLAPFAAAISVFTSALVAVVIAKAYQGRYSG